MTLSEVIKRVLAALDRADAPANAICTHHGVHAEWEDPQTLFKFSVNVTVDSVRSNGTEGTLITCYHDEWRTMDDGNEKAPVGQVLMDLILAEIGSVAPIIDQWNLSKDSSGGSFVIDRPKPKALAVAIENYRKLRDPFKLSPAGKAGFKAFDTWFDEGMA